MAQKLQNRQIAPRGTERKFFNDFSRAPALAYAKVMSVRSLQRRKPRLWTASKSIPLSDIDRRQRDS